MTKKPAKAPAKRAPRKAAPKKMGRPTIFSQALADRICARLIEGESLRAICLDETMPSLSAVFGWLAKGERQDFAQQYARARELQAEKLFDEIIAIADDGQNDTYTDPETGAVRVDHDVIARSKLRVDARKWAAAKLAPKKYGDKLAVGGAEDLGPIQTRTITDAERAVRLHALLSKVQPQAGKA